MFIGSNVVRHLVQWPIGIDRTCLPIWSQSRKHEKEADFQKQVKKGINEGQSITYSCTWAVDEYNV